MPNALTKKYGPLPAWAWLAVGVAFVGMVVYFRRSQSVEDTGVDYSEDGTQIAGSLPGQEGMTFISGGGGPREAESYYEGGYDIGKPVGYPPDFMEGLLDRLIPYPMSGSPVLVESPTSPYTTEPTPTKGTQVVTAEKATASTQASFKWDGVTYTKKDEAKFRAYLKSKSLTYKSWASKHPTAAMSVFGKMA